MSSIKRSSSETRNRIRLDSLKKGGPVLKSSSNQGNNVECLDLKETITKKTRSFPKPKIKSKPTKELSINRGSSIPFKYVKTKTQLEINTTPIIDNDNIGQELLDGGTF